MQLLGDGDEVGELPELHEIDANAPGPNRGPGFRNSRGLPHLGNKSWTGNDKTILLQRVIFVPTEQTAKIEVPAQQQDVSVQSPQSTRT
jgi:hypothetical protein